jgi:hypothetical protein
MKASAIFDETFRPSRVVGMHPPEIAQRFNAGFRLGESTKSRPGRQNRGWLLTLLSSLKGLQHFDHMIFPALKRWAIFVGTDAESNHPAEPCCLGPEAAIGRLLFSGRER